MRGSVHERAPRGAFGIVALCAALALLPACGRGKLFDGPDTGAEPDDEPYDPKNPRVAPPAPRGERTGWIEITPTPLPEKWPSARFAHAWVFDPRRQVALLFAGHDGDRPLSDVWEWNGRTGRWRNLTPDPLPPHDWPLGRYNHAMAWDEIMGHMVVFGGGGWPQETWAWDAIESRFVRRSPEGFLPEKSRPAPRSGHAMWSDDKSGGVMMWGGVTDDGGSLDDLWRLPGGKATWERVPGRAGATWPTARLHFSATLDDEDVAWISGGTGSGFRRDTWTWTGQKWTQPSLVPGSSWPPKRYRHAAAWDGTNDEMVVFGGIDDAPEQNRLGTTWLRNPKSEIWREVTGIAPSPRHSTRMIWDAARGRVLLFGGADVNGPTRDLWEWIPP